MRVPCRETIIVSILHFDLSWCGVARITGCVWECTVFMARSCIVVVSPFSIDIVTIVVLCYGSDPRYLTMIAIPLYSRSGCDPAVFPF